jgi:hypothetical protein
MSNSSTNPEPTLWMITEESTVITAEGEKAGGVFKGGVIRGQTDQTQTKSTGKIAVPVSQLQENLKQFLTVVGDLFMQAELEALSSSSERDQNVKSGIELDQIEFSVAVNGEGEVGFWGLAKGKVGGATEIKLTFKRKES